MCGGSSKAQRQMMQIMMIQQAQQAAQQRKAAEDAARAAAEERAKEKVGDIESALDDRAGAGVRGARGGKGRRSLMTSPNAGFMGRFG